jgi:hypothetical protein
MISIPKRLRVFLLFGVVLLALFSFGHVFREQLFMFKRTEGNGTKDKIEETKTLIYHDDKSLLYFSASSL